jgi:hypothetical protein
MTKSLSLIFVIGFALCFTSSRVQAISLSLEPAAQSVVLGNPVEVAVRIADLGTSGTAPALSTFDLDISFDPGILTFTQATFGDPVLGDQLDVLGLGSLALVTPGVGVVNLFELSFDLPEDLTALQASSFTLATLTFGTTALGTSALGLTVNALGDEWGEPLLADISGAMVTSIQDVSMDPVPEPGTLILLSTGLIGLVGYGRRWQREI